MKKIVKDLVGFILITLTMMSCSKQENKDYLLGSTAPVLTASFNPDNLSFANADNTALTLSWTNPNYKFSTGNSSQDVTYLVEIDTSGSNFTNPQRQSITVSRDLGESFSGSQLNTYLLNELLTPGVPHNLEIRVTASLVNSTAALTSNVVKLTATPYSIPPKVPPPSSGNLYLVEALPPEDGTTPCPHPASSSLR